MKEAKKTLLRVIGIMWGLAAVVLIVGAILFAVHPFPYFPYVSGEVLGTLVSGLLMWHRFNTLDVELDMAKKNAIRHLRMQASVRSLISLLTLLFWITTSHVCLVIVMVALIIFAIVANRVIKKADYRKAPTGFLNVIELLVETVDKLVLDNMGGKLAPRFRNYVGALFMLILTCNLSGLFGLRPPTADYGITLPLALITFVMIQYQGFKWQKMGKIKGLFEPIFVFLPVNIISEFATPVSMSLRLFANILSGTMMMALIYGLLPKLATLAWPAALHAYMDVFSGALQAYVFAMLTMVFIANAAGDEAK